MTDPMTPTRPSDPATDAGKALVEWAQNALPDQIDIWRDHAIAIESEAELLPLDLWSIARHVATDSSAHHPRFHHPSGECEQYGRHIHQPGFIVWERGS